VGREKKGEGKRDCFNNNYCLAGEKRGGLLSRGKKGGGEENSRSSNKHAGCLADVGKKKKFVFRKEKRGKKVTRY